MGAVLMEGTLIMLYCLLMEGTLIMGAVLLADGRHTYYGCCIACLEGTGCCIAWLEGTHYYG